MTGLGPGCSLTRGSMSSSPWCACRVHCSLRGRLAGLRIMALADLEKLRVFARLMKSSSHFNSISQCPYLLVAMRRGSILPSYFAIT
jgi:hypothetical protein